LKQTDFYQNFSESFNLAIENITFEKIVRYYDVLKSYSHETPEILTAYSPEFLYYLEFAANYIDLYTDFNTEENINLFASEIFKEI
jgi:hypothetical protein